MKKYLNIVAMAVIAVLIFLLAGCGEKSADSGIDNSADDIFAPDLAGTEWLGYRVGADGEYVASAEYVFTQDRIQYLDRDVEYTLHTGEEAYTEALITEEDGEALYTEDAFDGEERGGFVTIIMHYENGGKDGMYGWMNSSMDKMDLTDPYDSAKIYMFRRDSDTAVSSYEKNVEPYFDAFLNKTYKRGEHEEVAYSDRLFVVSSPLEYSGVGATEEAVKNKQVIDTIESGFDNDTPKAAKLAGDLESTIYVEGIKVRLDFTYKGELIASATYDKSGEIKEERFLYGR